jgi:hypothetical protein
MARNKATATGWSSGSNWPSQARVGSAFKNAELPANPVSHWILLQVSATKVASFYR